MNLTVSKRKIFVLHKHENYVDSNGKTADADKLCSEVSIELKMWAIFLINCTKNGVARNITDACK